MNKPLYPSWLTSRYVQIICFVLGIFIICLSTLTPEEQLPLVPGTDKAHHVIGFGGLALICAFGPMKRFLLLSLFIIFLGGAIEIIQPYVNRNGEWLDFYADALGVILVIIARLLIGLYLKSKYRFNESVKKT